MPSSCGAGTTAMNTFTNRLQEWQDGQTVASVFISFATPDLICAGKIKSGLQNMGIRCWKAPDDIPPGESWPNAITRALSNAKVMVLVCSSHSVVSRDVGKELTLAMKNSCIVVPFRIEDVPLSGEWAYHLSNVQWFDAFDQELDRSIESLGMHLLSVLRSSATIGETRRTSIEDSSSDLSVQCARQRKTIDQYLSGMQEELGSTEGCFTMLKLSHQQTDKSLTRGSLLPMSLNNLVRAKQFGNLKEINLLSFDKPFGRWIVTGAPGCGKSTLLRMLAVSYTNRVARCNGAKIPILLELGRYEMNSIISLALATECIGRYSRRSVSESELRRILTDHNIVWIMDGLDEAMLGSTQVNESPIWKEIEVLLRQFPSHSFVISTRKSHLPIDDSFETVFIKDLDSEGAHEFIAKYLSYFERPESAGDILVAIPLSLRQVATTPLILSLIISAYLSNGTVPEDINALYRDYVAYVLNFVEATRHSRTRPEIKDMALATLAFEILTSGRPVIRLSDARVILVGRINQLSANSDVDAESNVSSLLDELIYSGLLIRQDHQISFSHLSLLEYFAACEMSREYNFSAQAEMDQYFLRNIEKIRLILNAAAITTDTHVVEVGAGIGSVAKHLPPSKSLTLIDLDPDLIKILRYQFPRATVLETDAVAAVRSLSFDILVSNLPFFLTEQILSGLCNVSFRRAVMSVHVDDEFGRFDNQLTISVLGVLNEDDFFPRQPFKSKLILVEPKLRFPDA